MRVFLPGAAINLQSTSTALAIAAIGSEPNQPTDTKTVAVKQAVSRFQKADSLLPKLKSQPKVK